MKRDMNLVRHILLTARESETAVPYSEFCVSDGRWSKDLIIYHIDIMSEYRLTMNDRIKAVREYYILTQEAFGERIGLQKSAISRIESGQINPTEQTIRLILSEFDINEQWLRNGEGEMLTNDRALKKAKLINKYNTEGDPFKDWLLDCVLDLDDEQWKLIRNKIREGAEQSRARAAVNAADEKQDEGKKDLTEQLQDNHLKPVEGKESA